MSRNVGIPRYLKHSSGQARVIINGKVYYLGKHGTKASKQRYDALVAEWLSTGRSNTFGLNASALTLADVVVGYLRHCKSHYDGGSEYVQTKLLLRVVSKLYATHSAVDFGPLQYKAVRETLIGDPKCQWSSGNQKKNAKPLSRQYINAQMKRLARMFRWAAANGDVPAEVYNTLRLIPSLQRGRTKAPESHAIGPVPLDTVKATLLHCSPVVADMVRLQYLVAARPAEICRLTVAMIDRSGDVWVARLQEHKTAHHGRIRELHFGPQAQELLLPYLDRNENVELFSPAESEALRRAALSDARTTPSNCGNRPGYSNRTRQGRPSKRKPSDKYTPSSYAQAIRRAAEKANVEHWAPNQLRHAGGTNIRSRHGLEHSQATLGHSKADMTQHYAKVDREKASEVAMTDRERRIN